jgi:hypothetical protein
MRADVIAAAPVLERHGVGPFAGGFARVVAEPAQAAPACAVIGTATIGRNAFGGGLWRLESAGFTRDTARTAGRADWLLADPGGTVVGFLVGDRRTAMLSGASAVDPGSTVLRLVDPASRRPTDATLQLAAAAVAAHLPACDAAAPAAE